MPSREFNHLEKNTALLRKEFLSFKRRADGKYSASELMQCRAFITFCHAEVEHYLEAIAQKILDRAEAKWDGKKSVSKVIAGLLAYRHSKEIGLPDDPTEQAANKRLTCVVKGAFLNQRNVIKANNGLRGKNISDLFLPLGIDPDDIDSPLIIQLDNFGKTRGGLVHKSTPVSLPHLRDPFDDEDNDVKFLITDLKQFDALVIAL